MTAYDVILQEVEVAGRTWRLSTLADRQQYSDPDGEFERAGVAPASWSMFGVVWPAGLMLAEYMASCPIDGQRILEVGCGLGLASMVVQERGGDIIASDIHPLAEKFLAENAERNGISPLRFRAIDWRLDHDDLMFDLIIGSDLLYERDQETLLAKFVDLHCAGGGRVILTDPGRGQVSRFNRLMAGNGFSVQQIFRGKSRLACYARSTLSHQDDMSTT